MMMRLNLIWIAILVILPFAGKTQYYSLGQDPGSTKWRQINSENFRLIYPQEFESKANQFINLLEYSRKTTPLSLGAKVPKMPVVLHAQDITANAFSVWAPRRLELYTAPPQSTYAQPWLEQLAIHEFRHSAQLSAMNTGATKVMGYLLGEQAAAAVLGLYLPLWFIEGDAVSTETALSKSGRGRVPSFSMEVKAQLLEKNHYSYDKAVNGSFRDYIPDWYMLGYEMVARARQIKSDPTVWENTLRFVGRNPYLPWAFNRGLKKSLGMSKEQLYLNTMDDLKQKWAAVHPATPGESIVSPAKKAFTRYKFPHYLNDSTWIAERTSIDDIDRFVIVQRKGKETTAVTPGLFSSDVISLSGSDHTDVMGANKPGSITADNLDIKTNRLYWTEKQIDSRWQNRSYSVIKYADLTTGKWKTLTHRSRYFSPSVSHDGASLVVTSISESNKYSLLVLDSQSGKVLKSIISSDEDYYITPKWTADNSSIVCVVMNEKGKELVQIDVETGTKQILIPSTYFEISNPHPFGQYIFFNGTYNGIDNIYAFNRENKKVYRVTNAPFGAMDLEVSPDGQHLVYSDYTSMGHRIAEIPFNPQSWKETDVTTAGQPEGLYSSMLDKQEGDVMITNESAPQKTYVSEPYHKLGHALNFHSWSPFYFNSSNYNLGSGVSLLSQDVLSTTFLTLQYQIRDPNGFGRSSATLSYQALYPVFDFSVEKGRNTGLAVSRTEPNGFLYNYDETDFSGAIKVPLKFTSGPSNFGLQPSIKLTLKNMHPDLAIISRQLNGNMTTLDYQLFGFAYRKYGLRDLAPKWGLVNYFNYGTSPFSGIQSGTILAVEETAYLPGVLSHDGFRIYMGYQDRKRSTGSFGNIIFFPRGNTTPYPTEEVSLSFNYHVPLFYPDLSIGPLVYIKRVKANLFYDTTLKNVIGGRGVEISADVHLLRFMFPFDLGVQLVQSNSGVFRVNPLISINLNGI